jgi:hypothetical protein
MTLSVRDMRCGGRTGRVARYRSADVHLRRFVPATVRTDQGARI